jgi:hypothetical protein
MKLKDLKERVDWAIENSRKDLDVCIPNNKVGIGGTSVTSVIQAAQGIDWDGGKFIIWPEEKMVQMKEEPEELISLINYVRRETGMGKVQSIRALEECKEEIANIVSNWLRAHGSKISSDDRPNSQKGDVNIG